MNEDNLLQPEQQSPTVHSPVQVTQTSSPKGKYHLLRNKKEILLIVAFLLLVLFGLYFAVSTKLSHNRSVKEQLGKTGQALHVLPTSHSLKSVLLPTLSLPPTVNSSQYVGWQTYTTKLGASFKYPANWYVLTPSDMGEGVVVQDVNDQTLSDHSEVDDMPEYKDNFALYIDESVPSGNPVGALSGTNASIIDGSFPIDGKTFCLVGYHTTNVSNSPITEMEIAQCSGNGIRQGDYIPGIPKPGTEGTFLLLKFSSLGDGVTPFAGGAGYAISQSSLEYKTIISILQSVTY